MKNDETFTLYVDFHHISTFGWEDPLFIDKLMQEYGRFEPYLKQGLTMFLAENGVQITNQTWYQIGIYNLPNINKIRDLKTGSLGKILSIHGTVTRTTEVKPELLLGSFKCTGCDAKIPAVEQEYKYTKPTRCENDRCMSTEFELDNASSKFTDW